MNPNEPLSREQVTLLVREAPEAVVNLVMVMQEQIAELRAEVRRLQERVAELEEQNRPPSAPFRRREEQRKADPKKPGRAPGHPGSYRHSPRRSNAPPKNLPLRKKNCARKSLQPQWFIPTKPVGGKTGPVACGCSPRPRARTKRR